MAMCIMRMAKVKGKGAIRAIQKHNQAKLENVEAIKANDEKKFGYSEINLDNLQYNKHLVSSDDFNKVIEEILAKRLPGKKIRKDAVKMLDGVFTYSPEKTPNLLCCLHTNEPKWKDANKEMWEKYNSLTQAEKQAKVNEEFQWVHDYMNACVAFVKKYYGEVISADLHFHETTPHLHINTIPLVKGNDNWKLSAKDIMGNKGNLSKMQTCFFEEVGKAFGLERGKIRERGEVARHFTKEQKKLEEMQTSLTNITNDFKILQANYSNLQNDYESLQGKCQEIMQKHADILSRVNVCENLLNAHIYELPTETRREAQEHIKEAKKGLYKAKEEMKKGKSVDRVFGSLSKASHSTYQVEELLKDLQEDDDLIADDDFER